MKVIGNLKSKNKVFIYDTTLRDGAQGEGISFTVEDKMKITKSLDEFGIDYIEAGNPGSNPKDLEYFQRSKDLKLNNAKLVAFGSTRRAGIKAQEDSNVLSLVSAGTDAVAIFGKAWDFHVTDIIHTSLEENLCMIGDTISFFKAAGKEVIFDAEHFFDGYKRNTKYAMDVLKAAEKAGADWLVLCDTNGGSLPYEIEETVSDVRKIFSTPIGIHCHNDSGVAVANSLLAIKAGASQIQGTINGYGERTGNANLCTIIPNLQLKMKKSCVPDAKMKDLTMLSRYISELCNFSHDKQYPYVGHSAFAHKGGMHIDAVLKNPISFEHILPDLVGNERKALISEVSGKSKILAGIQKIAPWVTKKSPEVQNILDILKRLEHDGYQFEGAESSFELLIRRTFCRERSFFEVKDFRVICEEPASDFTSAYAMIKVEVDGVEEITAAGGDGPVNAMDEALRKALTVFYPELNKIRLVDYKVRVLNAEEATAAKVRVHIESSDGVDRWGTVGVSTNIIKASWIALTDSLIYFLHKTRDSEDGAAS